MKVCWLTYSPAPYTIRLFNEISKKVELFVVLFNEVEKNRNEEWKIKEDYNFNLYVVDKNYNKKIQDLSKECDVLIDGFYLSKYGYKAVTEFKKQNKKTLLIADGGIAKNRGFVINGIMNYMMNRHDYFLSSSIITDKYFKYYKVNESKIHHYKFTSLSKQELLNNKELAKKKNELRKELGIDDKFTLISVGRPIKSKGFDILLKSYIDSNLKDQISIYVIGGEPQEDIKNIVKKNNLNNVHFVGLLKTDELSKYYASADALILPTRTDTWGLVIPEAMSFGLPVITSDNCVAGLHFALLGNNPIICKLKNTDTFTKAIIEIYSNSNLRQSMSKCALEVVSEYAIEESCKDITNILSLL